MIEKQNISEYLLQFAKPFKDLCDSGLVDGVLGRGSYFAANGFPVENDNLNFMLLRTTVWNDEEKNRIHTLLKQFPAAYLWLLGAGYKEEQIGSGNGKKVVYFTLIDRSTVALGRGLRYEKYVLLNSPGIAVAGLSKERSESIAREVSSLLPDHNRVSELGIPRLSNFDRLK